jgi:NitT/TauT family transport system substrate-binding protein
MKLIQALICAAALLPVLAPQPASAQERVRFATNWKAQAAHGGFYQAVADGTYKRLGLDVEILQGGPQVNNRPLLPAGRIEFLMTGNLLHSFDNVKNKVPTVVVAATFQKDPQAIFAHPNAGYASFKDLTRAPVAFIAKDAQFSFWQWMKAEHGFRDEALRPYTFNLGPFLANKQSIQQGYSIEEPLAVKKQAGFDPLVFLLADQGYNTYSTTIETRTELVQKNPELVRKFVEGSIIGWNNYLYGDRKAAHALIRQANPDATDEQLEGSVALMKKYGVVDSGDSLTRGIGAIDEKRIADFYAKMVKAGLYKAGEVDLSKVVTTQFVNKGVGLDVKKRLGGK